METSAFADLLSSVRRRVTAPLRHAALSLSPGAYVRLQFRRSMGVWPNLREPRTFNEKVTWQMLYDKDPLRAWCGGKAGLRQWVEAHGLGHMLPKLYGVWDRAGDVDLAAAPERFVLKCTHGCHFNIVCRDKASFDLAGARRTLDRWLRTDFGRETGELHYSSMRRMILCEEFLDDCGLPFPTEYKAYTFHGDVHCFAVGTNRVFNRSADWDVYDRRCEKRLPYYEQTDDPWRVIQKPASLDEMVAAAAVLGRPFPFVRIDFYDIGGRARIGEMTFTPGGGRDSKFTETAQTTLGDLLQFPVSRSDAGFRAPLERRGKV